MENSQKPESSNWSEWSIYVLKELERLNEEADDLYKQLEEHNASRETLDQVKRWKLKVESIATFDDLRKMKENVVDFKTFKTQVVTTLIVAQAVLTTVAGFVMWWVK